MRGTSCERDAGGHDDAEGERQVGRACLDRRVAEHVLHVEREEEEHRSSPANATSCVVSAAARPLTRKIDSGSSGLRLRCSLTTNAASSTSAPVSSADRARRAPALVRRLHEGEDQQQHPAGRRGWRRGSRSPQPRAMPLTAISQKIPPSTSSAASGLTNITQRQPGPSVSRPPRSTPAAEARPPTAPQTAEALLRSVPSLKSW